MTPSALFVRGLRNREKLDQSTEWNVEAKLESDVVDADSQLGSFADQVVVVANGLLIDLIYFILKVVWI